MLHGPAHALADLLCLMEDAVPMELATRTEADRKALTFAMNLSLGTGVLMLMMKVGAYLLTGSAAILSDAAESVVHIAAVGFASYSLRLSHKPADDSHLYGHAKIEFFSAGFEGAMIILAALYILYASIQKWIGGVQLEHLGWGTFLIAASAIINGALGGYLLWLGRKQKSLLLRANGTHVLTDCWTSVAVLVGLGLVYATGWLPFDPICGILMAGNILFSGIGLLKSSFVGLMDSADPAVQKKLVEILEAETKQYAASYHRLRHRPVGDAYWIEVHLLFPDGTLLREAHRNATAIEQAMERALDQRAYVTTHLESAADHRELHPNEEMG